MEPRLKWNKIILVAKMTQIKWQYWIFLLHITRPHCSTTYVDAAYCYRSSSMVCLLADLSACHSSEPCKNVQNDQDSVRLRTWVGPSNYVLMEVQIPPWEGGNFEGIQGGPL